MLGRGFSEIDDAFDKVFKHWPYPTPAYYRLIDEGHMIDRIKSEEKIRSSLVLSSLVAKCIQSSNNCSVKEVKKLQKKRLY